MTAPATPVDPAARLIARVPADVRAELALAHATLVALVPVVVAAMRRIKPLTDVAEQAMAWPTDLSPAELEAASDDAIQAAEDRLGVGELWGLADALHDAHPDNWRPQ